MAGVAFCGTCGVGLGSACAACGAVNHPKARRCGSCGVALRPGAALPALFQGTPARAPAESRRIVTVLFADLVGYTDMVERYRDRTEDVRRLVGGLFDQLATIIGEHGGTVEKFIGDAICALFGAPLAHEDDPERALRCALALQNAMAVHNAKRTATEAGDGGTELPALALRVGIATGDVVAGPVGYQSDKGTYNEYTVTGDTVNTAARLQAAGQPGSILVGAATERLTRRSFVFEPAGFLQLKGKAEPVAAFILQGEREGALEGAALQMVGRERDIEHLLFCLHLSREGDRQLVEVTGDAGSGKSRLIDEFARHAARSPAGGAIVARGNCPPHGASAYFPFRSIVADLLSPDMASDGRDGGIGIGQMQHRLEIPAQLGEDTQAVLGLLGEFAAHGRLSPAAFPNSVPQLRPPAASGPAARNFQGISKAFPTDHAEPAQILCQTLCTLTRELSYLHPVVIIIEDMHRADVESLELFRRFIAGLGNCRVMLVWTRRAGEEGPLEADTDVELTRLRLRPLDETECEQLLTQILDGARLPAVVTDLIVSRSDGNPFYIGAIIQTLLEDEILVQNGESFEYRGDPARLDVPATVQGLIQSRLDRMPAPQRLLLQEAAVVGREFNVDLLEQVELFGIDVEPTLEALEPSGVIEEIAAGVYRFRHVLTQEVAYDGMLSGLRTELHREIAEAIEEMHGDRLSEYATILADHYAKAGDIDKSVECLILAGQAPE